MEASHLSHFLDFIGKCNGMKLLQEAMEDTEDEQSGVGTQCDSGQNDGGLLDGSREQGGFAMSDAGTMADDESGTEDAGQLY